MMEQIPGQFHFIRPYFLLLLFVAFWFGWYLYKKSKNTNAWNDVCDPNLLSYLLVGSDKKTGLMPVWLALIVGILLSIALAGPTWTKLPQAVYKKESARVFILDLSHSMDATDVKPSRSSRTKLKLIDFLNASEEGQSALVVYAAEPHVVSPLTDDAGTIVSMIPSLSPGIMPAQGSRTDLAIIKAAQLLSQAGNNNGEIVLLTDGSNGDLALEAAKKISSSGYTLNVIGVGTQDGSPIPVRQGGFLKDRGGAIVIPKLDKSSLKELALAGGGRYVDLAVNDADVALLIRDSLNDKLAMNDSQDNPLTREVDLWQDEGHWFLLFALPFLALGFRRGWLTVVVISVCYMPQGELYAFEWQDLWVTQDQQARKMLDAGEVGKAAEMYKDSNWKGTAFYKDGNFEKAAESFSQSESIQASYNLANALAKQGKLDEALEVYDEVLKKDPDHEDAKFNKDLVKKAKDSQKQKPGGDESQESEDGEEKSDEQKESEEQQQSGSDESEENKDKQQSENQSDSGEESEEQKQQQAEQNKKEQSDEEKEQQAAQEKNEIKEGEEDKEKDNEQNTEQKEKQQREIQQATQQWLRRIPDDPGGLLREKFSRQYQRQQLRPRSQRQETENPW